MNLSSGGRSERGAGVRSRMAQARLAYEPARLRIPTRNVDPVPDLFHRYGVAAGQEEKGGLRAGCILQASRLRAAIDLTKPKARRCISSRRGFGLGRGGLAAVTGLDRDRAFYPTVLIVVASYYDLFGHGGLRPGARLRKPGVGAVRRLGGHRFQVEPMVRGRRRSAQ